MTSRSVRAQEHEEVRKPIQRRAVVRGRTAVFVALPVMLDILAVTSNNIHVGNKLVGFEPCCEHNNVGRNKSLVGFDTLRRDSFGFCVCQQDLVVVQ